MTTARARVFESPSEYLSEDHDRLDALLAEARIDVELNQPAAAAFRDFRAGLERHIHLEEAVLFPAFERHTGMTGGPTAVMRHEHELIKTHLAEMGETLLAGDAKGFRAASGRLEGVLASHNLKEERMLYPAIDRLLRDDERRALVAQLRSD